MRKLARHLWRLLRSPLTRIFLLLLLHHSPVQSCPTQCDCPRTNNGTLVLCRDKNLNAIPQGIPVDASELDLSSNNIVDLFGGSSGTFHKVTKISLDFNEVKTIYNDFFKRFPNIEVISLDSNKIEDIHQNAFNGLTKLKQLYLQSNQLTSLRSLVLNNLTLDTLNLERNNIENIQQSLFESVTITTLNMDYNNMSKISDSMFRPLQPTLKHLSLSYNKRPLQVDKLAFQGFNLDELKLCYNGIINCSFLSSVDTYKLDLSGNPIQIPALQNYPNLEKVEEFILVNNSIQALDAGYFDALPNLKVLDLTNNKLTNLPTNIFLKNVKLETLLLSSNKLDKIPKGLGISCPRLVKLMLSSNRISHISTDVFNSMQLQELDLSYNLIQVFEEHFKPILDNIRMLALNGNHFHCNCEMRWFREWLDTRINYTGADKCHSPTEVNIYELKPEQFVCKPPVLLYTTSDVNVTEGETVLLSCTASGDPAPEIKFTDPSSEGISISPQKNRTKTKTYAMWQINSIPYHKGGFYTCKASNAAGSVEGSICIGVTSSHSDARAKTCVRPSTISTSTASTTTTTTTITTTTTSESTVLPTSTSSDFHTTDVFIKSTAFATWPPSNVLRTTTNELIPDSSVDIDNSKKLVFIIAISCAGIFLVLVIVVIVVCFLRKRKTNGGYNISSKDADFLEYHKMNGKPPMDVICNGHALV